MTKAHDLYNLALRDRDMFPTIAIVGEHVHCGEFTRPDGTTYSEPEVYEHNSDIENLTPELWYDDPARWSVKKLVQFKGNK